MGDWELFELKTLVYRCASPVKGSAIQTKIVLIVLSPLFFFFSFFLAILDRLIDACRNIDALHIGNQENIRSSSYRIKDVTFLSDIRFSKLTSLSIDGFHLLDGSYISSVRFCSIIRFLLKFIIKFPLFY